MISPIDYLNFIRNQPCIICADPEVSPHHIKRIGMGRNRSRPLIEHFSAIPLCHLHHRELHDKGEIKFYNAYGVELWQKAHSLLVRYITNEI